MTVPAVVTAALGAGSGTGWMAYLPLMQWRSLGHDPLKPSPGAGSGLLSNRRRLRLDTLPLDTQPFSPAVLPSERKDPAVITTAMPATAATVPDYCRPAPLRCDSRISVRLPDALQTDLTRVAAAAAEPPATAARRLLAGAVAAALATG
mgnify:CR=1 FL=1